MAASILKFPHKELRAEVIVDYVKKCGDAYKGIVCITCGSAGAALVKIAKGEVEVVIPEVPEGEWWTMEEIAQRYPGYFDATSGHLPLWLMERISKKFREYINNEQREGKIQEWEYRIPTGSGETIIELMMCMDNGAELIALYDYNRGSQFEPEAPLNNIVSRLFKIHFYERRNKTDDAE